MKILTSMGNTFISYASMYENVFRIFPLFLGKQLGRRNMKQDDSLHYKEKMNNWYDAYSTSIFKYIVHITNDYQQAEDLTQDTFIRVFNYMNSGKTIDYPKTFIYRTAHNVTVDFIRKNNPIKVMKDFVFQTKKSNEKSIEHQMIENEEYRDLHKGIASLKKSYREVIHLRKMEEFSIKDTAHILNWSESKVKSTLFRAMRALEKELIERGYTYETYF